MSKLKADAVVIGGGAAGMLCSAVAAERGLDVILLEPNKVLGRKMRITGKGRCNVTNNCDIKEVYKEVLKYNKLKDFVKKLENVYYEELKELIENKENILKEYKQNSKNKMCMSK